MRRLAEWFRALGRELLRRRVLRTGGLYLAGALVGLELAELVFQTFSVSGTLFSLLVVTVVVAFPAVLVLAWHYDLSPEGITRTATSLPPGQGWLFGGVVGVGTVLLAGASWWVWLTPGPSAPAADPGPALDPARVAVLYLDDHSPEGDLGFLAAGLTEGLIHELAQVEGLEVLSRHAMKPFRTSDVALADVVAALRAGSIVEGSVTRSPDSVRLVVQLIDGADGTHLASRSFSRPWEDVLHLQDALSEVVAEELRERLGREVVARGRVSRASSLEALHLLERAEQLLEDEPTLRDADGGVGLRALEEAYALLGEAEALDPAWIDPVLRRGEAARRIGLALGDRAGAIDASWADSALAAAGRAERLDSGHPDPLVLRAAVRTRLALDASDAEAEGLRSGAEADLRRALDRAPGHAGAWWALSRLHLDRARPDEALRAAERAWSLDAFLEVTAETLLSLWEASMEAEAFDAAERWCTEGRRRRPGNSNFVVCHLFLMASVPAVEPDVDRAWLYVDTLVSVVSEPRRPLFRQYGSLQVAKVLARAGRPDSARAVLARYGGPDAPAFLAYDEAHARLLLGEEDAAVDLLARFLESQPGMRSRVAEDWWFRPLRDDPRFRTLVESGRGET